MSVSEEMKVLAFLLIMSAILRFWQFQNSPIEHFDEGVYASNIWFDAEEGYRYPDRHLYAPPLVPAMIEWSHLLWGPGTWACLGGNLIAGCVTVLVIWRFLRRIAGPVAGLTAAALWSFHDLPVLYARTALTESLLCLLMLGSVSLAERVLSCSFRQTLTLSRMLQLSLAVGFLAGLAWCTKYNGWLTLAIIFSATIAWATFARLNAKDWIKVCSLLGLITLTALLTWSPVLYSLQATGGYAAVAENHRQYFVGLTGWLNSLQSQMQSYWLLTSLTSLCGLFIAFAITFQKFPDTHSPEVRTSLGHWMIASWWIGLGVAIPLYHPYPRLMLPWILASCLVMGLFFQWMADCLTRRSAEDSSGWWNTAAFQATLALLGLISLSGPLRATAAWQDRRELQSITQEFIHQTGAIAKQAGFAGNEVIFYVYGEPALFYHLSAAQRLAGPIGHLDFARPQAGAPVVPTFLIVGPHAQRSPLFQNQWQELGKHFELVAEAPYTPSLFIQRNDSNETSNPSQTIRLYRQQH